MSLKKERGLSRLVSAIKRALTRTQSRSADQEERARPRLMTASERKAELARKRDEAERRALDWALAQQEARREGDESAENKPAGSANLDEI